MIRNNAPLDSGGIRAADSGAHRRTRDRRRRNPHLVNASRARRAQFHVRRRFQALQLSWPEIICYPSQLPSTARAFFTTASYCAPTNITAEKTLRPFDSIDSRIHPLTRVSNVAPTRGYRQDPSPIREDCAVDFTCAPLKNDNSGH